jgi:hypothetical protein
MFKKYFLAASGNLEWIECTNERKSVKSMLLLLLLLRERGACWVTHRLPPRHHLSLFFISLFSENSAKINSAKRN